jgi:hypothetical protein
MRLMPLWARTQSGVREAAQTPEARAYAQALLWTTIVQAATGSRGVSIIRVLVVLL